MIPTDGIDSFITQMVKEYPEVESIWLFGSRANNSFRVDSDWDLLVFANEQVFGRLKDDLLLQERTFESKIDLLVVHDGEKFSAPWDQMSKGVLIRKEGNLYGWKWKFVSLDEARYESTKESRPSIMLSAYRIWPIK